ncbi:unnamed protein product [Arabidopsis halleri]
MQFLNTDPSLLSNFSPNSFSRIPEPKTFFNISTFFRGIPEEEQQRDPDLLWRSCKTNSSTSKGRS